jgi:hypothetical protein
VESDLELMCSRVARTVKPSPVASSEWGILHLAQVSPFGQKIGDGILLACLPLISFEFPYLRSSLFLAGLGSEGRGRAGVAGGIFSSTGKNIDMSMFVRGDA